MNHEAWTRAHDYAAQLPEDTAWVFCVTNDEDDAVLNIWAQRPVWHALRLLFTLGEPDETNADSITWYFEGMALSFIQSENNNEHESFGPDA